jgi:hypothetical protein
MSFRRHCACNAYAGAGPQDFHHSAGRGSPDHGIEVVVLPREFQVNPRTTIEGLTPDSPRLDLKPGDKFYSFMKRKAHRESFSTISISI